MAFKRIRKESPVYLPEHRKLLNYLRSMLQLEGLITKHSELMSSFGISHLPDLLAQCGVSLVKQFDMVLGITSPQPRHRDKLAALYDPVPEKRFELTSNIQGIKAQLKALYGSPLTTFAHHEEIKAEIAQLHVHLAKLEAQLSKLPEPAENGYVSEIFSQVGDEILEQEGFIVHSGEMTSYPYHLSTKSVALITQILAERDRIRSLLDRREPVEKKDVDLIWHDVRKAMPIKEVNDAARG